MNLFICTTKSAFFVVLLNFFAHLLVVRAQASPGVNCFVCPSATLSGLATISVPDYTSLSIITCVYSDASICVYETTAGALISSSGGACVTAAPTNCRVIREIMRQRALPRSPKPPSPAAFVPKPKTMKTRASLGKTKRRSQAAADVDDA